MNSPVDCFLSPPLGRIVTRIVSTIALRAGPYLALFRPAPLSSVGWLLAGPACLLGAHDTFIVDRHAHR